MTTSMLNTYYCTICAAVAKFATKIIDIAESMGRARAAAQLAQMGYHTEAKAIMLGKDEK